MDRQERQERYERLEQEITDNFLLEGSALGSMPTLPKETVINIFAERRGLVSCFTFMCEQFGPVMEIEKARDIVFEIYREEMIDNNHRVDYYKELAILGIDLATARKWRFSNTTNRVWEKMIRTVRSYLPRSELDRLLLLRYAGEYLPGIEFTKIYRRLEAFGLFDKHTSVFLYPHVLFDTTPHKGLASHADRYLALLLDLLQTEDAWERAGQVLTRAARIRQEFYSQFLRTNGKG